MRARVTTNVGREVCPTGSTRRSLVVTRPISGSTLDAAPADGAGEGASLALRAATGTMDVPTNAATNAQRTSETNNT
ncbi:MAG: hypothetical protein NVSMB19_11490 [Vulcanimicrobiaceae bacterium]